ncbi:hypothetical protein EDD33_1753 [Nocardioides aurantiacus]|uniref:Uncharacterized protein n=1 Tax=Nocardioides aurantiacus TaxID=86796 RepID=A0A3N2CUL1_9ACTN|nr:hypothetical protein EDD33_1753 [Nocardioides aurantiacus]
MLSVTYEVRPGLSEQESHLYVDAVVELRPRSLETIWATTLDQVPGSVPEEREESAGGPVTAGAFGPFVCPEATERIVLRLQPYQALAFTMDGRPLNPGALDLLAGVDRVTGTASLDLVGQTSCWEPDQRTGSAASQTRGQPVPRAAPSRVRHRRPMGEPGGGQDHLDFDGETQFDRWVQDPGGRWFHIQGLKTVAVSTPILIGPANGGPGANVFWRAVNAVLVRVQRPGTAERCQLTVFRVGKKRERPVWGFMGDWQEGQLEAGDLVAEIRAGTFDPQSRPE